MVAGKAVSLPLIDYGNLLRNEKIMCFEYENFANIINFFLQKLIITVKVDCHFICEIIKQLYQICHRCN